MGLAAQPGPGAGTLSWEDLGEAAGFVHVGSCFPHSPARDQSPLFTWAEPRVSNPGGSNQGPGSEVTCFRLRCL